MPIFEYRCKSCGHGFEDIRSASEADAEGECPKCGACSIKRIMSSFSSPGGGKSAPGLGSCGPGGFTGGG